MGALGDMLKGHMIADIITTFGQINMIGGECDR
jgi:NADH-quinone oxidoreductase subunit D